VQITFDTPFGFSADSTPAENRTVNGILRDTLDRLNQTSGARATLSRSGRSLFDFDLPSLFGTDSTPNQDGAALQALLVGLITLNRAFLVNHAVPDLYRCGVIYGRTDIWDTIPALYAPKSTRNGAQPYGDCKSVSACLVAERLKKGQEALPVFRWIRTPLGTKDYHILVLTPDGFEDPSKVLGMGRDENTNVRL